MAFLTNLKNRKQQRVQGPTKTIYMQSVGSNEVICIFLLFVKLTYKTVRPFTFTAYNFAVTMILYLEIQAV
jgi:hypothetical protein